MFEDVMTAEAGHVPLLAVQHPDGRYLQSFEDGEPIWTTESTFALDLGPSRATHIVEHLGPVDRGRSCRIVALKCEMVVGYKIHPNGEDVGDEIYCSNEAIGRGDGVLLCENCGEKLRRYLAD